jgi:hypothetical protein
MIELEKKLTGIDAESGKQLFALPLAPQEPITVLAPVAQGWLLGSKQKLRVLDRRGRVTVQISLPAPAEHWALAARPDGSLQTAFIALADETLAAVDLTHGQMRGRLKLGRFVQLAPFGERALAVDTTGVMLVLDGAKALRP